MSSCWSPNAANRSRILEGLLSMHDQESQPIMTGWRHPLGNAGYMEPRAVAGARLRPWHKPYHASDSSTMGRPTSCSHLAATGWLDFLPCFGRSQHQLTGSCLLSGVAAPSALPLQLQTQTAAGTGPCDGHRWGCVLPCRDVSELDQDGPERSMAETEPWKFEEKRNTQVPIPLTLPGGYRIPEPRNAAIILATKTQECLASRCRLRLRAKCICDDGSSKARATWHLHAATAVVRVGADTAAGPMDKASRKELARGTAGPLAQK